MRILFVCTGNICRSPMAEALAKRLLKGRGREDVEALSAGTAAYDGSPASEGAYLVGLEHGLDLSGHQARMLTPEEVGAADLILGMGPYHVDRAVALGARGRAYLLGDYAGRPPEEATVEDPFGGDLDEYRRAYAQLEELLPDVIARLLGEQQPTEEAGDG